MTTIANVGMEATYGDARWWATLTWMKQLKGGGETYAGQTGTDLHLIEKTTHEIRWLRLHGLAMCIILPVIGTTLAHHAHCAWRLGKNMTMGAIMGIHLCWLAASGYALYCFASDTNEAWLPLAHWLPGLCLPLIVFAHVHFGRARITSRNVNRHVNETPTLLQEAGQ